MKRLIGILIAAVCVLPATSQVICTDVVPDVTNSGNASLDIDLDNDNTPDFRLTSAQIGTLSFVVVQGSQIGTTNYVLTNGSGDALALPLNTPIGPLSTTWTQMNSTNQIMLTVAGTTTIGSWSGASDQYLGLRLVSGTNSYYGWARFSFTGPANTYVFKDYAYESSANNLIPAGQGCATLQNPAINIPDSVCTGSTFSLTSNTGTASATTYSWSIAPGGALAATNVSATTASVTAAGVYTVQLTVTSGTITGVATSTLYAGTPPAFSVSPVNTTVCQHAPVTLTASGGAGSYSWSPATGLSATTGSVVTATLSASQVFTVTGTQAGCASQQTAAVQVNTIPQYSVFVSSTSICAQPFISSPASSTISLQGAPGYTLVGAPPGALVSTAVSNSVVTLSSAPPHPTFSTMVSVTLSATDGTCTIHFPMGIGVFPNPTISLAPAALSVCPGEKDTISVTGTSMLGWLVGTGGTLTPIPPSQFEISTNATTTFTVFGIDGSCMSDRHTLQVVLKPAAAITVSNQIICSNASSSPLYATGTGSITWTGTAGAAGTGSVIQFSPPTPNPAVYQFTVTADNNGCTASAVMQASAVICNGINEHQPSTVKVYPQPVENTLRVKSKKPFNSVRISDTRGATLINARTETGITTEIDVSHLAAGIYVAEIQTDDGTVERVTIIKSD